MKKKYEMLPRLKYLESIGHIFMNVTDLVNEGSDNNGQDTKAKGKPKISEVGDVDVMDSTTIVNEISPMEDLLDNPPSEDDI